MSNSEKEGLFSETGLATKKDGFAAGIVVAILLRLGFVRIVVVEQSIAIWILLLFAVGLTVHHVVRRGSLLTAPLDGFIMGFGWLFGILNILQTIPK